ncbi:hypothetical protein [Aquimarina rhabdastrellae]
MYRFLFIFSLLIGLYSCDDGDIIVTEFDFDDIDLERCNGAGVDEHVFYKINTSLNEAIALNFTSPFSETPVLTLNEVITITLSLSETTNQLLYRKFTDAVSDSYFCGSVPPSDVTVTQELLSTQGEATIETRIAIIDDNDGIPSEEEDLNGNGNLEDDDTDGDGLPNYRDPDDDNDNILTSNEIPNGIPNNDNPRDTDEDGIPDYLEADDDNDGVLTINEDISGSNNPRDPSNDEDGDNILNYLDNDSSPATPVSNSPALSNAVRITYRTTVTIINLEFNSTNNNFNQNSFILGTKDASATRTITN